MDLKQRKLNKSEWTSIEVSVPKYEVDVLSMIIKGFNDVNIKINDTNSIFTFLKIEYSDKMEDYLFNKYFRERSDKVEVELKNLNSSYAKMAIDSKTKLNSADKVRLERFDENTMKKIDIYEFILLTHIEQIVFNNKTANIKLFHFHYFTLYKLIRNNILKLNRHIKELVSRVLKAFEDKIEMSVIIENAVEFIEKNDSLLKYSDLTLYEHQKQIFI
jgi:hypothetical protein